MPGPKDWLIKASNDLKAAKKLSDETDTFDCSVFHTHQCAEKALKGFMVAAGQRIPKTHDLKLLIERCVEFRAEIVLLREAGKDLNAYGSDSRYPNDYFFVDKQEIIDAIQAAEKILTTIKQKV